MVIKCKAKKIKNTTEISLHIKSKFNQEQLKIISKEIIAIDRQMYLDDQVQIGGDILGSIFKTEDFNKVLLLSQYIDEIVTVLQSKRRIL